MTNYLKTNLAVKSKFEPFYVSGKVEVSSDGQRIFAFCGNAVKVFNVAEGRIESTLQTDEAEQITIFALNASSDHLVTASRNLLIREWNWRDSVCLKTWKAVHHAPISCMSFDATGDLLATGSGDTTIKIWHSGLKCHTHSFRGSQGAIGIVKFHPETARGQIFSASDDYLIRAWNLSPAKQLAALRGHFSSVTDLHFSVDGNSLISAGRDKVLILWDIIAFVVLKTLPVFEEIESFVVLPSLQAFPEFNAAEGPLNILSGGSKGILSMWNLALSRNLYSGTVPTESEDAVAEHSKIVQLTFVEYIRRLFVILADQSILIYDLPDLEPKHQFSGYNDEVFDIKFLRNETFALVATNSPRLKLYNLTTADCKFASGHTDSVLCISVLGEELIVTGSKDCNIRLWKFKQSKGTIKCVAVAVGHTSTVGALVCSGATKHQRVISGSEDSTLKIWDVATDGAGKHAKYSLNAVHTEVAHDKGINSVAVSPDDKWIATAGGDKTGKIWKASPFGLTGTLRGHRRAIWCIQFAPHDQIIGTSSADGTIKLWAVADFRCVKSFDGHDCSVMKFQFLSRGLQLLSSGSDGLLKLWDVRKNTCIKTFDEHGDKIWTIEVSKNEELILTGAGDSTFLVWKDVTEEQQQEEKKKLDNLIIQEQELMNLLDRKQHGKAVRLALSLDQPHRLLKIFCEMISTSAGQEELAVIIKQLEDFQLDQILTYVMAWNTNSRHTFPAQFVLSCIFKSVHPKRLLQLSKIKTCVEGLIPYTERHAARLDQLHVNAMFFRYLWNNVKELNDLDSNKIHPQHAATISTDSETVQE